MKLSFLFLFVSFNLQAQVDPIGEEYPSELIGVWVNIDEPNHEIRFDNLGNIYSRVDGLEELDWINYSVGLSCTDSNNSIVLENNERNRLLHVYDALNPNFSGCYYISMAYYQGELSLSMYAEWSGKNFTYRKQ